MRYEVRVLRRARDAIKGLAKDEQKRMYEKIHALSENAYPAEAKKLRGYDAYRLRVGDYRILYTVRNKQLLVIVVAVGHRSEIYQELRRINLE